MGATTLGLLVAWLLAALLATTTWARRTTNAPTTFPLYEKFTKTFTRPTIRYTNHAAHDGQWYPTTNQHHTMTDHYNQRTTAYN